SRSRVPSPSRETQVSGSTKMSVSSSSSTGKTSYGTFEPVPKRVTPQRALNAPTVNSTRVTDSRSDTDALREQFAVVRRVAEEDLRALRALEVEVRVVLPREADAAVDLDVLGRGVEVRLRAVRLREGRNDRKLVVVLRCGPRRVVRGGLARLDLEQHVG